MKPRKNAHNKINQLLSKLIKITEKEKEEKDVKIA